LKKAGIEKPRFNTPGRGRKQKLKPCKGMTFQEHGRPGGGIGREPAPGSFEGLRKGGVSCQAQKGGIRVVGGRRVGGWERKATQSSRWLEQEVVRIGRDHDVAEKSQGGGKTGMRRRRFGVALKTSLPI